VWAVRAGRVSSYSHLRSEQLRSIVTGTCVAAAAAVDVRRRRRWTGGRHFGVSGSLPGVGGVVGEFGFLLPSTSILQAILGLGGRLVIVHANLEV
jgi:hypothetical protein